MQRGNPDSVVLTVHLATSDALAFRRLAQEAGFTVHRFHQLLLSKVARGKLDPALAESGHANLGQGGCTVPLECPHMLMLRLAWTARQMRTPSGTALPLSTLARQVVMHYCGARSDVLDRIKAETNPAYVDVLPLDGTVRVTASHKARFVFAIRFTLEQREIVRRAAEMKGMAVSALIRAILERALPDPAYLHEDGRTYVSPAEVSA